jgi:epsilon-lactone hydrolase
MSDPEIAALRAIIAQRPRSDDIGQRRRDIDARGLANRLPADVTVHPVSANGVKAEWTETPEGDRARAILFLHGGGYVIGSLDSHRHLVAEAGRAARMRALAIDYRLAPEHPFPAAVDDALAAYRFLLAGGIQPGGIAIAGDSAGGGLVVATMLAIREAGLAQPACGWAISPWVDMEATGASMAGKAAVDPTVQKAGILDMARLYLNSADPRSPLAAPIYGDLRGLAPLLIQVGAAETLLDDAIRLAQVAGAADVAVDLQVWPEMIHVWHTYFPVLSAGRRAIASGGEFIRAMTSRGTRVGF